MVCGLVYAYALVLSFLGASSASRCSKHRTSKPLEIVQSTGATKATDWNANGSDFVVPIAPQARSKYPNNVESMARNPGAKRRQDKEVPPRSP